MSDMFWFNVQIKQKLVMLAEQRCYKFDIQHSPDIYNYMNSASYANITLCSHN